MANSADAVDDVRVSRGEGRDKYGDIGMDAWRSYTLGMESTVAATVDDYGFARAIENNSGVYTN